LSAILSLHQ